MSWRASTPEGKSGDIPHCGTNEEYVKVISVDPDNQTFDAIVTSGHTIGERTSPTIWPTPIMNESDGLAFDILVAASPDPGPDLTVVIQT